MLNEKVEDYPDLMKIDKSYVVNVNEDKYRTSLARRKAAKQLGSIEDRVCNLENKIQLILDILQGNSQQKE
jgi:hypothetical protein